jgi:pimeloyl-ACP methyl ester carboxylesterase
VLRVLTAIVSAGLLFLSWAQTNSLQPLRRNGMLPIDPPTPFFKVSPPAEPRGRVLVIHGLDASKNLMQEFSYALADGGFEVVAIDLPGHGDSPVGFTAMGAQTAVARVLDHLGDVDFAIGHSLGAGLLLDLANERSFKRLVLLSPPPTPIDAVDLRRTLVVTGTLDIPAIKAFVPKLEGAEQWHLQWAGHSSVMLNPVQTRDIVRWMGGDWKALRMTSRLFWDGLMIIAALVLGMCLLPETGKSSGTDYSVAQVCARFVLVAAPSVLILKVVVVLQWLQIYSMDYLISAIFLIGFISVAFFAPPRSVGVVNPAGLFAAAYFILVVCLFAGSHFMNFSLTGGRWWRFPLIALASFPLFLYDETALKTASFTKTLITGLLTRGLLGASILMGVLTLNRDDAFLVLIIHLMVLFWVVLWLLTHFVRSRTGSPLAAAIFASLVQGWIFAAWFVTT